MWMSSQEFENKVYGKFIVSEGIVNTKKVTLISQKSFFGNVGKKIVEFPTIFDEFAFSGDGKYFYGMKNTRIYFYDFTHSKIKVFHTVMKNFGADYNKFLYKNIIFLHNNVFYVLDCETLKLSSLLFVNKKEKIENITVSKCKTYFTYEIEGKKVMYNF